MLQRFIDANETENIVENGTYRKVLGLHWFIENDSFEYDFTDSIKSAEELPTAKRNILSFSAMFYHPLGMISSITLQFRLIFHSLHKYYWDTEIEPMHVEVWNKIVRGLKLLKGVSVAHHVLYKCGNREIE